MRIFSNFFTLSVILSTTLFTLIPSPAQAHVGLDFPNGGEIFNEGETIAVEWHVIIQHNQLDWDLWYSTTSNTGPWTEIVMDLPTGDPTPGSIHTYDWTIPPEAVSDDVWVRVRQDNVGVGDYYDVSDESFAVLSEFALLLTQSDLIRGQEATLQVEDAETGETVFFLYSLNGEGDGPSVPQLGGLNLDILPPINLIGPAIADPFGTATITIRIPSGAPLIDVSTQAVIQRGTGGSESVKSNPNTAPILP
jgi:hypothetical protein